MSLDLYSFGKNSCYSNLVRISEFYNLPNFDPLLVTDAKISHYLKLMQQKYILHWQHTLEQSKKLEFYNTVKIEYTPSYYLDLTKKITNRRALVELRIGNHELVIESGRYDQKRRENRLCLSCRSNEIEEETQFLFNCPKYSIQRDEFYNKVQFYVRNIKQLPQIEAIKELMNSSILLIFN